jgi:RimJ/RimL family protein N-acetyltransferase
MIEFGQGVILRKIEHDDMPKLFAWRNDPRIWKWCRQNDAISWSAHEDWYQKQASDSSIKMYSVFGPDDKLVGCAGLTSIDLTNRRAEFSLYVDPNTQRDGLGTKTLKTLVLHGFLNLGLNNIWGESFEGNPAISLFEKLNFKQEGMRRSFYFRNGRFIHAYLYSLLHSECSFLPTDRDPSRKPLAEIPQIRHAFEYTVSTTPSAA